MLQGLDRLGLHIAMSHPKGEGAGKFSVGFPRFEQRIVPRKQHLPRGGQPAHAVFGDDARIRQGRHGGGRHQGDVGTAVGKCTDCFGGIGQQQIGTEITFVLNTKYERRRTEARHGGYTWNYDHHP